ncbi:MAG: type II secretion system protein GspC [Steroidobacter sp.]
MSFPASLRDFQNLSPQQWLDRTSRSLPRAVCVVLVVAIAWQLVQLSWLLLDRTSDAGAPEAMAPFTPSPSAPRKGVDVQAIVSAHLFGIPEAETSQGAADAPQTQMNLVLSGVLAFGDPQKGLAFIGESAQATKVYTVGAAVRSGTKLHSVYLDRVILDRSGQLETLALPKQSTGGVAINRPPAPAANNRFTDNLRRIAETNPTAFAEIVRPQPVFANGVQRGYRVYPGRNRQQFAKLGLQPGDLVLAINGTPLDDPQRGMEIFNTMGTSDRVNVTIERSGQSQELTLNTAQITLPEADTRTPEVRPRTPTPAPGLTPTPPVE